MTCWSHIFLCLLSFAIVTKGAKTEGFKFESGPAQTALLELYTSEGCSSCPPAETWFSQLQGSPRLWKDFVPVAFHVDYWNYLGWKDRWSDTGFSERQRAYARFWRSKNIYTPEFVLNGREWHNWFTGKSGPRSDRKIVGNLVVTSTDTDRWQVIFTPAKAADERYEIHAAVLAGRIVSNVKEGENAGRQLKHDFVVMDLVQIGLTSSNGVARGKFIVNQPREKPGKTLALAVWVTMTGQIEPVQATGGWLIAPANK